MTRAEHIEWCKDRAHAYLPHAPTDAVASFASDIRKHDETKDTESFLLMIGMMAAQRHDAAAAVRDWIDGFN